MKYLDPQVVYYDRTKWSTACWHNRHKACSGGRRSEDGNAICECPHHGEME